MNISINILSLLCLNISSLFKGIFNKVLQYIKFNGIYAFHSPKYTHVKVKPKRKSDFAKIMSKDLIRALCRQFTFMNNTWNMEKLH